MVSSAAYVCFYMHVWCVSACVRVWMRVCVYESNTDACDSWTGGRLVDMATLRGGIGMCMCVVALAAAFLISYTPHTPTGRELMLENFHMRIPHSHMHILRSLGPHPKKQNNQLKFE